MKKIVLGSNSITRAELLDSFGVPFIQRGASFDEESLNINNPSHFVYRATLGKMNSYVEEYGLDLPVVCADTVVTCKDKLLRKAKNKNDAREILLTQSGGKVSILTCMIYKAQKLEFIDLSSTDYIFEEFDKQALEEYLLTDEWEGKAGACMVEGFCKAYIKEVRGYESTAMGLCVEKLLPFLQED
ncbi:septum formation inhibitor Maf [Sulfurospirillum arcachonense]|uniref:septum formation inhibitor Maf n=1 Tax=Sulfurospirillum arcachonense TaxID=57666 RepID=UPI0004B09C9F|nr:septum formation inhibitor Maf [Sulfurospirillum arcachonense]